MCQLKAALYVVLLIVWIVLGVAATVETVKSIDQGSAPQPGETSTND